MTTYTELALAQYEPLRKLINRPVWRNKITELSIIEKSLIAVRCAGKGYIRLSAKDAEFVTEDYVKTLCTYFAGCNGFRFDDRLPQLACRTPDGHRFHAVVGPVVVQGLAASIRVKRMVDATWKDFAVKPKMSARITRAVEDGKAIFISGGTASGKTTFLNMISRLIPSHKRIITVEDTPELDLPHWNRQNLVVSRTESASLFNWSDAIEAAMRLNPTVFLVGEITIRNAFPALQALDTGHESFICSMHANSCLDAMRGFHRRTVMGAASAGSFTETMEFLANNIALIIQLKHVEGADGKSEMRMISEIARPADLWARYKGEPEKNSFTPEERTLMDAKKLNLDSSKEGYHAG